MQTSMKKSVEKRTKPNGKHAGNGKKRGPPFGSNNNESHGLYHLKRLLQRGLEIVPQDSALFPVLGERRRQIEEDLGGKANLSQLQLDMIDEYLTTSVILGSVDG